MPLITTSKQIGIALSARRKSLALSQAQTAQKLGLSQNRLSELETHPETMTVDQLLALCGVLGLEIQMSERGAAKHKAEW